MIDNNRGIALILVLWVMVVLILLAAGVAMLAHTETQISRNYGDVVQCKWAARAGVYSAMQYITTNILTQPTTDLDSITFPIQSTDPTVNENLGNCTFQFTIEDEGGKLNVNGHGATAALDVTSEATLTTLFGSQDLADAIMDWRNPSTRPSSEGAESAYYNTLTPPYNAKNAPFETVQELNLVKGITPDILSGSTSMGTTAIQDLVTVYSQPSTATATSTTASSSTTTRSSVPGPITTTRPGTTGGSTTTSSTTSSTASSTQINIQTTTTAATYTNAFPNILTNGDAQAIISHRSQYTNTPAQIVLSGISRSKIEQIYSRLTVTSPPAYTNLINVNTAPLEVLASQPGMTTSIAQAILTYRQRQGAFSGVGYILAVSDVTNNIFISLAPYLTVRSRVFKIISTGTLAETGTQATITCVVQFGSNNQTNIRYWQE